MRLKQFMYLPWWYFNSWILKKKWPLQTVLFITDYCNLKCKHCTPSGHQCAKIKSYEKIRKELEYAYNLGARFVDFEGGEPTLWEQNGKTLNDLYRLAKEIGFFSCTLTTNGQRPFGDTLADSVWVSVDGYKEFHDSIRGEGTFEKLDRNIRLSKHPNISIAMAVNRLNRASVADTIRYAKKNPHIQSIAFNLHTPLPETKELMLSWQERCEVIDEIMEFKRKGYPIMNTRSGLKVMKTRGFKKECWVANYILVDGTRLDRCPGSLFHVCSECGFCMSGEMHAVLHLHPDTIRAGIGLRMPFLKRKEQVKL